MPDVPTIEEAGVKGFEIITWYGFFARAGTLPDIVAKIDADSNKALHDPALIKRLDDAGLEIGGGTPEASDTYV